MKQNISQSVSFLIQLMVEKLKENKLLKYVFLLLFLSGVSVSQIYGQTVGILGNPIIDGNKCDNDGYLDPNITNGFGNVSNAKCDIGEIWYSSGVYGNSEFYFSFTRNASGQAGFAIYFDVDGNLTNGTGDGADIAIFTGLSPSGGISDKTVYSYNGTGFVPNGTSFTGELGSVTCNGTDEGFIEIAVSYDNINFNVCSGHKLRLVKIVSWTADFEQGNVIETIDFSDATFTINTSPTLSDLVVVPNGDICRGEEITFSTVLSDVDGIDDLSAFSIDIDTNYIAPYTNFEPLASAYTMSSEQIDANSWELSFTFNYPTTGTRNFAVRAMDPWDCDLDVIKFASVTIVENTNSPVISCPVTSTQDLDTDAGECSYTHSGTDWDASATDIDPCGDPTVRYELIGATSGSGTSLSGVAFNKGTTTVTWYAEDGVPEHTVTCSFDVVVSDTEDPTISCAVPSASYASDNGECSYTVPGTGLDPLSTGDNCGVATVTNDFNSQSSLSGAVFPVGTTTVKWIVTDDSGNTAECSFDVTVTDDEAPVLSGCPSNISQSNDAGECSAVV
ncbi:HYR domain-containing protein, partial [Sunxiuqinia elliptica]